jgi:hypothetical protein
MFEDFKDACAHRMEQKLDFTIDPFKPHKHGPRSDKGKHHNYPKTRKKWQ